MSAKHNNGFTFIELLVVIIIVGILSAVLIPRYWEVVRQARIASLDGVVGAMRSAINITRTKALSEGIVALPAEPASQAINIVQMEGFSAEVDWRNLCPESRAELDDQASMLDYIYMAFTDWKGTVDGDLYTDFDNRYTWVGYDIRPPNTGGCYVRYDSFGDPMCTIEMIITDC